MPFSYGRLAGSAEGVQAMDDTRAIVVKYYTVEQAFAYSRSYENWETDKIIQVLVSIKVRLPPTIITIYLPYDLCCRMNCTGILV